MTRKILCFFFAFSAFAALLTVPAGAAPDNSAGAAVLMHADTGEMLFQKNADSQMLIASTTKLMTALVVLENCALDEVAEISAEDAAVEGSSMYLMAGESLTVEELLYGLLLVSGNDAAQALACHCAGSIEAFADLMNKKAAELGLEGSCFKNPHGLDAEGHHSTAKDLAEIMRAAMALPDFERIISTKSYTVGNRSLLNHNRLLWSYKGMLGGKTGYTMAAGRSLVTCAERDGLRLICVTLSDPDDWDDHKALYDWAFESFRCVRALPMGGVCRLPVIGGEAESVGVVCPDEKRLLVKRDSQLAVSFELPEFVYAGIKAGDTAGRAFVTADGVLISELTLRYEESVPSERNAESDPWRRLKRAWIGINKYGFVFES